MGYPRVNNIELWPLERLIPYEKNSKKHPDEQVEQIANSIKEFGFNNPILVDGKDGIVAGHGRLMAAKYLEMENVPVIILDHLTDTQKRAYIIADNKLAENAEWHMVNLTQELEELEGLDFDLELLGFSQDELNEIFPEVEQVEGQTDEDSVPEIKSNPMTKRGDIWILGNHRVMCGDSTMIDDVEKLMDGQKADMVFTDPPYGVSYQSNMRTKSEKFDVLQNDDEFLDIVPIISSYSRGFVFIWSTWKVVGEWLERTSSLGKPSNTIVWHKGGGGIGDLEKTFLTDWELALVWHRGHKLCGKRIGSVWSLGKDSASSYRHPTQKPVSLAEEALDKCSKSQYKVLDLFGGSGSTLIACEKMNRRSYNMELDEKYCDVIIKRWQDYTGKQAILESTGEKYNDLCPST
jgi:DNA modification methylase